MYYSESVILSTAALHRLVTCEGVASRLEGGFVMPRGVYPRAPLDQRFWSRVEKTESCWLWQPATRTGEYGKLTNKILAHRFSWELHYGSIPEGLWVLHHCDTPPCVHPEHLFLGTAKDNNSDSVSKGRHAQIKKTHCPKGHPYEGVNLSRSPCGDRRCRECNRVRARKSKELY